MRLWFLRGDLDHLGGIYDEDGNLNKKAVMYLITIANFGLTILQDAIDTTEAEETGGVDPAILIPNSVLVYDDSDDENGLLSILYLFKNKFTIPINEFRAQAAISFGLLNRQSYPCIFIFASNYDTHKQVGIWDDIHSESSPSLEFTRKQIIERFELFKQFRDIPTKGKVGSAKKSLSAAQQALKAAEKATQTEVPSNPDGIYKLVNSKLKKVK